MRDIPVGNGNLLVNFDDKYQIRDIYFPHVGQENHTEGFPFRFGVWADGEFSWVFSDDWARLLRYKPETLVTDFEEILADQAIEPLVLRLVIVLRRAGASAINRLLSHVKRAVGVLRRHLHVEEVSTG